MLGNRDQEQVEEVALLLGRLAAGEQQVEVLGEREPAHQLAGQVPPADLDPVRKGLADLAGGGSPPDRSAASIRSYQGPDPQVSAR